jgi:spore germination protein GerM
VVKTPNPARAALNELLYGLSWDEANAGYFNSINQGVKINSLNIVDGVARADFDKRMDEAMGGSCRVAAIRAQITQTLMQFPTVKSVVISVDGNSEEALQP